MPGKPHTGKLINCLICNKSFYIPINRFSTAKFCSYKCMGESSSKKFIKKCEICLNEFEFIATRIDKAKYCSRKCYHKGQSKKGKTEYKCFHCGKLFLSSKSSKRKYCSRECVNKISSKIWDPKFSTVRKKLIKLNKINECNRCGFNLYVKILGVHHKDRNRNNNDISNLEVLCPNCHSIEHMKHIPHGFKE